MKELLAYRIPHQDIVKNTGKFHRVAKNDVNIQGFIVSSFDKRERFVFEAFNKDIDSSPDFHFSSEEPTAINKEKYVEYGRLVKKLISNYPLDKFVFSRVKKADIDPEKIMKLFETLCHSYANAFVYLISSKEFGTWVGATPETLIEVHKDQGFTMSLAGTKEIKDKREWSKKEYREQELVSSYIMDTLNKKDIDAIDVLGPYDSEAGSLLHLRTDMSFDLKGKNTLELADVLHPTPAVCGLPKKDCIELIDTIERRELHYSRALYAGYIGVTSKEKTQLYVNLRCCQIIKNQAFLYLGGGYTSDSDVLDEWNETENKSNTLLDVFELL